MMKTKLSGFSAGSQLGRFAAAAGLVLAFAPTAQADGPAPKKGDAKYEVRFLTDMIDHHHMAVEMSMMCLDKATHPELRDLCQSIIDSQSAEIDQMHMWLMDWYGLEHEPEMSKKHERLMEELEEASGAEFEILWLEEMIDHHGSAVKEAGRCMKKATHDDLRGLCEAIDSAQRAEIDLMGSWLCTWYGEHCDRA